MHAPTPVQDGRLLGIVGAILQVDWFEHLFARIATDGDPTFAVFRDDGALLVRYPHADAAVGQAYGLTENLRLARSSENRAVVARTGLFDGKLRLIAPHSVSHYPLLLTVTNAVEAGTQPWRERMRWMIGLATMAELVLGVVVVLGVRQLHGQERLAAANAVALHAETARVWAESELAVARQREAAEHDARMQSQRFDLALSNMQQGLAMFDSAEG